MQRHDDDIEKLIVRKLDGNLSDDESLELDRLLIRSPEAHRLWEEYQQQDAKAASALAELFPPDVVTQVAVSATPASSAASRRSGTGYRRAWWGLPVAVAACLGALVIFNPPRDFDTGLAEGPPPKETVETASPTETGIASTEPLAPTPVRQAQYDQGTVDRSIGQDWYGVRGSDGNIYWLQIDHTRTLRRPGSASKIKLANGDL